MSDSEDGRDDGKRAKGGPVAGGGPTPRASLRACDSCRAKKVRLFFYRAQSRRAWPEPLAWLAR